MSNGLYCTKWAHSHWDLLNYCHYHVRNGSRNRPRNRNSWVNHRRDWTIMYCTKRAYLPPANEVWGKVIFLHQFVILFTGGMRGFIRGACVVLFGGACMVLFGGHAWFYWGACMVLFGGCACFYLGGAYVVLFRGAYMVLFGGMPGFIRGVCVVLFGGHAWFYSGGMHGFFQFFRIQWDTVNERAVRILLECILPTIVITMQEMVHAIVHAIAIVK